MGKQAEKGYITCPGPHSYHDRIWLGFWIFRGAPSSPTKSHTTPSAPSVMLCGDALQGFSAPTGPFGSTMNLTA